MNKQHQKKKHSLASTIIYYISIVVLIICIVMFAINIYNSYKTKKDIEKVQDIFHNETTIGVIDNTNDPDESPILPQFESLLDINPETIGWVTVPNTTADFVVVQKTDEEIGNEYYLKHDFFNESSESGAVFMDRRDIVTENSTSDNLILYGHNQADKTMFGDLKKYKDIEFYKNNPVLTFSTLYNENKYKIISYFVIDSDTEHEDIFDYHNYINFNTQEKFDYFISEIKDRSYMLNDVDVKYGDNLLTLSTCSSEFSSARFVIVAREVRDGESSEVDVSSVTSNPNIKRDPFWTKLFG